MKITIKRATFTGVSVLLGALAGVRAQGEMRAYYANDPAGRNVVTIESRAPIETMVTTTGDIKADIKIDTANVLANPVARFEINMDSLDTGIALRNEHMRGERWLDTKKFPRAIFVLTKVLAPTGVVPLVQGQTREGEVEGELSLHGVTKTVRAKLSIATIPGTDATQKRLKGDMMHIRATFSLVLADFGVNVPAPAQLEIAPVQSITVDVFSSTGSDAPKLEGALGAEAATANAAQTEPKKTEARKGITKVITMDNGLQIEDVTVGTGDEATDGKTLSMHYRGTLPDGKQFDASYDRGEPFEFQLGAGQVIKGWDQGIKGMKVGGKRKLTIPPALGYGARGAGGVIPPNATLLFDVELLKVS